MKKVFSYFRKNNNFFPIIKVRLKGPKEMLGVEALIDSGASFSVFRGEVADYLGVSIEKGVPIYLTGIGGRILGYLHECKMSVDNKNFFNCKIVFSREFNVSFNLLGRDNFFHPYIISFLERNRKIVIKMNNLI